MKDASVIVDYIYLDSEERRRFAQVGHEYLIEQVQHTGAESVIGRNNKWRLNFNHPCKEIVWAVRSSYYSGSNRGGSAFLAYTHADDWSVALEAAAENLVRGLLTTDVSCGDSAITDLSGATSGSVVCTTVTVGSTDIELWVNVVCDTAGTASLYSVTAPLGTELYGKISKIEITLDVSAGTFDVNSVAHTLTVADISLPVDCYGTDNRCSTEHDCHVTQLNYGLSLDGTGNPVALANLQLNGHDRFDPFDGNYFNYVQTDAHHTRTPADGINVYSFALHPEQHQPSGTANLSRIDNTTLVCTLEDGFKTDGAVGRASCDTLADADVLIYAVNYNILRVMSGMAGMLSNAGESIYSNYMLVMMMFLITGYTIKLRESPVNYLYRLHMKICFGTIGKLMGRK
jgi:hypothetical protein